MIATAIFCIAAVFILYVLLGYPLLLALLVKVHANEPAQVGRQQKSVSIIIAVHNGEAYIARKLESLLNLNYPKELMEILVVADGCTDATETIAKRMAEQGVEVIALPRSGKCAALNAGMAQAHGEAIVFTDVRQLLAPDALQMLIDRFADPAVGVVSGELIIRDGSRPDQNDTGMYWRYEKWIRKHLSAIDSIFGATGAFYAMRRNLVRPLPDDMLLDDMYLPLSAFSAGYRLVLESGAYAFDEPASREEEFKRKVRTLAGNYQILRAYPWLLTPANRMWLHYVSYKFGRLLLPWALLALLGASFFLPDPWRVWMLAAQAIFYCIAVVDFFVPSRIPLKRISSPACTFVVLMIATVVAVQVFFVPARSLWKQARTKATPN